MTEEFADVEADTSESILGVNTGVPLAATPPLLYLLQVMKMRGRGGRQRSLLTSRQTLLTLLSPF
jgi:hypothetical protein